MTETMHILTGCQRDHWDIVQSIQHEPFIYIVSNGSKWGGESPDSIEDLLAVLDSTALDPQFEQYGNFVTQNPCDGEQDEHGKWGDGERLFTTPVTSFFGNFLEVSHVFNIYTNVQDVIATLTAAIRLNQHTPAYTQAKRSIRKSVQK